MNHISYIKLIPFRVFKEIFNYFLFPFFTLGPFVCGPKRRYSCDALQQFKLNIHYAGQGYDSTIPDGPNDVSDPLTEKLAERVGKYVEQYVEAMEKVIEAPFNLFM